VHWAKGCYFAVKKSTQANWVLLLVSALWGASYPIARASVAGINSFAFVLARFALAATILSPFALPRLNDRRAMRLGAVLGLIEGVVCAILTWHIVFMPASRCAFIMGVSVVMVPLWSALLGKYRLRLFDLGRAGLSLLGLFYLTGATWQAISAHDVWVFCAAVLWALTIVILKEETLKYAVAAPVVAFWQSLSTCVVPGILLLVTRAPLGQFNRFSLLGLAYCAVFASVVNLLLQTTYQKFTTAAQAALRLSLEPLFACAFGVIFFAEQLTLGMLAGAFAMLAATLLPEIQALYLTLRRPAAVVPGKLSAFDAAQEIRQKQPLRPPVRGRRVVHQYANLP
jgi:drug/metabolite transporter (DMT)-like permease